MGDDQLYFIYACGATHIFLSNGLQTEGLLFCLAFRFVIENQVIESRNPKVF